MKINVQSPFTLTRDDGERVSYKVGIQEVEQWVADHWFVKAHSEPVDKPEPQAKSESKTTSTKTKTEG